MRFYGLWESARESCGEGERVYGEIYCMGDGRVEVRQMEGGGGVCCIGWSRWISTLLRMIGMGWDGNDGMAMRFNFDMLDGFFFFSTEVV